MIPKVHEGTTTENFETTRKCLELVNTTVLRYDLLSVDFHDLRV